MKNLYLICFLAFTSFNASSQTLLFGGANGNGDFENGTTDWTFVNGSQANQWVVGSNATPGFSGSKAVYISSGAGAHQYNTNSATYSYFYKDISIPAGVKTLWLSFDYISAGEAITGNFGTEAKDALRIWGRSTSENIVAGQELNNVFISAGAGFYNQATWKRKRTVYFNTATFAGSTMRLIFQWFNDGANGTQPPAALDNLELYASCQEFINPYEGTATTATSSNIIWNTVPGATGYWLRYKKIDEPNSVSSYANPVSIAGGSTYNYTISGLTPSSSYIAEISTQGTACTEYSSAAVFSTVTPPSYDSCHNALLLPVWSATQPGTLATFNGATATASLANTCTNGNKNDVWFKFVAQHADQTIQTNDPDFGESFYAATDILLYTGDCNNLQPVALPCASSNFSVYQSGNVTRLAATGLTIGTTYYVRVITNLNDSYLAFNISVYNPLPDPECPTVLRPKNDTVLNYGVPFTLRWTKSNHADAYRVRIIEENLAYTEIYTRDTLYNFTPSSGKNYTWLVRPFNVLEQSAGCVSQTFSSCAPIVNNITVSAPDGPDKCAGDSVKLVASSATNIQWFRNNIAIAGATSDTIWVKEDGSYTIRIINGSCLSNASNSITVTNLSTPVKPTVTADGATTFCSGDSVVFTSSFSLNNQWYNGTTAIPGATGNTFTAKVSGQYYVRLINTTFGCASFSDTTTVTVNTTPDTPTITASVTTFCIGDSSKLTSSAASNNQWFRNNAIIGGATANIFYTKQSGEYYVKTNLNGCESAFSDTITVIANAIPAAPVVTVTGLNSICEGDSAKLTSSVATGLKWYKNGIVIADATNAIYYAKESGIYTAKITSGNCESAASSNASITVNAMPAKPTITVNGFTLTAPAGQASYQWYFNNTVINGATAVNHIVLQPGNYKVEVGNASSCKSMSDNINAVVTGLNDVEFVGYKIALYPNPVIDDIVISVKANGSVSKRFTATVTDVHGKAVAVQQLKDGMNKISLRHFAQGNYFVSIRTGNTIKTITLIKGK